MSTGAVNFEAALRNPAMVLATPEEIVAHPAFTTDQKIEILRQWGYDARS